MPPKEKPAGKVRVPSDATKATYLKHVPIIEVILRARHGRDVDITDEAIANVSDTDLRALIICLAVLNLKDIDVDNSRKVLAANRGILQAEEGPYMVTIPDDFKNDDATPRDLPSNNTMKDRWSKVKGALRLKGVKLIEDKEAERKGERHAITTSTPRLVTLTLPFCSSPAVKSFLKFLYVEGEEPRHQPRPKGKRKRKAKAEVPRPTIEPASMTAVLAAVEGDETKAITGKCPSPNCNTKCTLFAELQYHWLKNCHAPKSKYMWCGFCCQFLPLPPADDPQDDEDNDSPEAGPSSSSTAKPKKPKKKKLTPKKQKLFDAPYVAHARECSLRWADAEGWTTAIGADLDIFARPGARKTEDQLLRQEEEYFERQGEQPCKYSVPSLFLEIAERRLKQAGMRGGGSRAAAAALLSPPPEGEDDDSGGAAMASPSSSSPDPEASSSTATAHGKALFGGQPSETVTYHFCPDCLTNSHQAWQVLFIHRTANYLAQHYSIHLLHRVDDKERGRFWELPPNPTYDPAWKCTYPRCEFEAADARERVNHLSHVHGIPLLVDSRGQPQPRAELEEGEKLERWSVARIAEGGDGLYLTLGYQEMRKRDKTKVHVEDVVDSESEGDDESHVQLQDRSEGEQTGEDDEEEEAREVDEYDDGDDE